MISLRGDTAGWGAAVSRPAASSGMPARPTATTAAATVEGDGASPVRVGARTDHVEVDLGRLDPLRDVGGGVGQPWSRFMA